jgi:hypothetical protein
MNHTVHTYGGIFNMKWRGEGQGGEVKKQFMVSNREFKKNHKNKKWLLVENANSQH